MLDKQYIAYEFIRFSFLLALRRWGRFARRNDVPQRETSRAAKSGEKRMFSQATN